MLAAKSTRTAYAPAGALPAISPNVIVGNGSPTVCAISYLVILLLGQDSCSMAYDLGCPVRQVPNLARYSLFFTVKAREIGVVLLLLRAARRPSAAWWTQLVRERGTATQDAVDAGQRCARYSPLAPLPAFAGYHAAEGSR